MYVPVHVYYATVIPPSPNLLTEVRVETRAFLPISPIHLWHLVQYSAKRSEHSIISMHSDILAIKR